MKLTRKSFLKAGAAALAFPMIVPAGCVSRRGKPRFSPNERIEVGLIGLGRISTTFEQKLLAKGDNLRLARIVGVCDLDTRRVDHSKGLVENAYRKALGESIPVAGFQYVDDMLASLPGIDAVCVSVPDHAHCLAAVICALAGKHIWMQKPFSQTVQEGRLLTNLVKRKGLTFQISSQQRSAPQFRNACAFVRNGRLGKIVRVEVGLGIDKEGGRTEEMPVPKTFDYDAWLGATPEAYYTEDRCHTQDLSRIGSRPGWIQMAPYGWGMITNWGAHHLDIVQWGLGTEDSGPVACTGNCEWMKKGLWNVHTAYDLHYTYPGGIDVHVCNTFPNGVKFIGEKGDWIFVSRGAQKVTASDPTQPGPVLKALDSNKPELLLPLRADETPLHASPNNDHMLDWLTAVRTGGACVTNVESAFHSANVCTLGHLCMEMRRSGLGTTLGWNPRTEQTDNAEINKLLRCPERGRYSIPRRLAAAGYDPAKQ
ncbi:MAG: Gfo/Idh/MocA family oxidoreductase [Kiritimatiellae bacterium]|nr:Gfo/Idh/MocA family oxidoreductase [Kiritimatiellia bacterium]